MSVVEEVSQKVGQLPVEQQLEILDFVDFVRHRRTRSGARRNPAGILANASADLTFEELKDLRKEMWQGFPREIET